MRPGVVRNDAAAQGKIPMPEVWIPAFAGMTGRGGNDDAAACFRIAFGDAGVRAHAVRPYAAD